MSQQYPPQQPNQPYQQQPQQPGWGAPQQGWGAPPQPPKKNPIGKILGFGCLGIIGLFVVIGIISAAVGGGSSKKSDSSSGVKPAATASKDGKASTADKPKGAADDDKKADSKPATPKKKVVTFKVWGTAPAGALGPLDITYGSDSDNRKGKFVNGKFEATLPLNKDAMYYSLTAQLQGSGDINCSVTINGKTKRGHASGGYNICDAQLSSGLLGGWD
ncbi:hypothetical protein [Streptomyces sp. NPDC047028]|uniref:hypothetical protein n=1 Tax=Streptomyces sp. NPDC047028 TaxID=3155793 RepID=UPI0034043553